MMKRMLMFLLALMTLSFPARAAEAPLTLFAINVGRGDALLLNAGSDTYLIDTATEEHWGDVSRALKLLQVEHLTGVILTHTDKDHCGGLLALASSSIGVDAWYASPFFGGKVEKHPMVEAAGLRGQEVQWLHMGDTLPLGDGRLTVIGPRHESDEENDNSLVFVAEGGGGRMLLAGDMEHPEEEDLLKAGVIPPCEVLKVPNHGDGDATSAALLQAVKPDIALISTSTEEKADTPADRVVKAIKSAKAKLYETQDADIGVLVTLDRGKAEASLMGAAELPKLSTDIAIAGVDKEMDAITLRNDGKETIDLSGWYIVSEKGGEIFVFPQGAALKKGMEQTVSSLSSGSQGVYVWLDKTVWHKSKDDPAVLYDVYGREVERLE